MSVSSQDFRDAFALAAFTVAVVTTDGDAGRRGLTATSYASVSDSPPSVLVCIERGASSLPVIIENGRFCLNLLSGRQAEVSDVFAGRRGYAGGERFDHVQWRKGEAGLPVIEGALAAFECRIVSQCSVSTHEVLVGEVMGLSRADGGKPLLYTARSYRAPE